MYNSVLLVIEEVYAQEHNIFLTYPEAISTQIMYA